MESSQPNPSQFIQPARLASEACQNDEVPLMEQAIAMASNGSSRSTVSQVIQAGLKRSIAGGAVQVLSYLLDHGADISTVDAAMIMSNEEDAEPSHAVLEILVAHGWDVNARRSNTDWPLLWHAVQFPDLLAWCLAHGAKVSLPEDDPPRDANGVGPVPRKSLLECAAKQATVATFELLRARGAPLEKRTLHATVEQAAIDAPPYGIDRDPKSNARFEERLHMVRYLVDKAGLEVNSEECWPGKVCATPLFYVANYNNRKDVRELVWFLLDRGADPNHVSTMDGHPIPSPMNQAQSVGNERFLEAVREWQGRRNASA